MKALMTNHHHCDCIVCDGCVKVTSEKTAIKCMKCNRRYCVSCSDKIVCHEVTEGFDPDNDALECCYCTNSLDDRVFTKDELLKHYGYTEDDGDAPAWLRYNMICKEKGAYRGFCYQCEFRCDEIDKLYDHESLTIEDDPVKKKEICCCYCKWTPDPDEDSNLEQAKVNMCSKCRIKYDAKVTY